MTILEFAPFAPFATAVVVAVTFGFNLRFLRLAKSVDVVSDFRKRFDALNYDVKEQAEQGKYPADAFYRRFWELQYEQYTMWIAGFIPDHVYRFWMSRRAQECRVRNILGMSDDEGWNLSRSMAKDVRFVTFMERVRRGDIDGAFAYASRCKAADAVRRAVLIGLSALMLAGLFVWVAGLTAWLLK